MCNWCFLCEGLTGTSSVCEKKNNTAKLFGVYRSVRLRVKPLVSPMWVGGSVVRFFLSNLSATRRACFAHRCPRTNDLELKRLNGRERGFASPLVFWQRDGLYARGM